MIDLSLAGLIGAVGGIVVAALVYGRLVAAVEHGFRARQPSQTAEEQATLATELALLRRAVLAIDMIAFAAAGYWLGKVVAG